MKPYKVFFQIYGRKMVAEVYADSPEGARQIILGKVQFDKIVCEDDPAEELKEMLGMK